MKLIKFMIVFPFKLMWSATKVIGKVMWFCMKAIGKALWFCIKLAFHIIVEEIIRKILGF